MAIIKSCEETLINLRGTDKVEQVGLDGLIEKAHLIRDSFSRVTPSPTASRKFLMDSSRNLMISLNNGFSQATDISEYAFGQLCTLHNIPAQYMKRCYDQNMDDVVDYNFKRQYDRMKEEGRDLSGHVALVSEGVTEAIVSDKYSFGFQTPEVLETIKECMPKQYQPNQAYLSKSRAHIRFVDFDNPEDVNGEKMSVGFTVGTSDIGKAALRVQFFLYKFACKNGIVRISHGGTLYKQTHIGEPFTEGNIAKFRQAFSDITMLRETALKEIANAQSKRLTDKEMQSILDTCRRYQVGLSDTARNKIIDLANIRYGRTMWGVINGITEAAQDYTLDTRLNYEIWAGKLLQAA